MELRTTFPKSVRRLEAEILDYRTSKEHCWSMWLRKLVEKAIIDDSNKHSLEIEMPMTMNSPKGHLRKCEKEARQRLDKA